MNKIIVEKVIIVKFILKHGADSPCRSCQLVVGEHHFRVVIKRLA